MCETYICKTWQNSVLFSWLHRTQFTSEIWARFKVKIHMICFGNEYGCGGLWKLSHDQHLWSMDYILPGSSIVEFSRQEYWSGYPFPSPGDLPDEGIEPTSLCLLHSGGRCFTSSTTWEAQCCQEFCFVFFLLYSRYGLWHLVGAHLHKHLLKEKVSEWTDEWTFGPDIQTHCS